MDILLHIARWFGIFLIFLTATKLIQTVFLMVTAARNKLLFEPSHRNQIVIWLAVSYLLTAFAYLVA